MIGGEGKESIGFRLIRVAQWLSHFKHKSACFLYEPRKKERVAAKFITHFTFKEFALIMLAWDEAKIRYRKTNAMRPAPEHETWNWKGKATHTIAGRHHFVGIQCEGQMQGLIQLLAQPVPSRRLGETGKPVLYIEYLEAAPWNLAEYVGAGGIRYKRVGQNLLKAAQEVSFQTGCNGRLALHSLDSAQGFYESQGFENLEFDSAENYNWYESSGMDQMVIGS